MRVALNRKQLQLLLTDLFLTPMFYIVLCFLAGVAINVIFQVLPLLSDAQRGLIIPLWVIGGVIGGLFEGIRTFISDYNKFKSLGKVDR